MRPAPLREGRAIQPLSAPTTAARLSLELSRSLPRKRAKLLALLKVLGELPRDGACLDLGTGHGGITSFLTGSGDWTFVEPNGNRLAVASQLLSGRCVRGDGIEFLRADSGHYRLISCIDTFDHFPDSAEALRLMRERLEPGGRLLITGVEHWTRDPLHLLRRTLGLFEATGYRQAHTAHSLSELMRASGFEVAPPRFFCGVVTAAAQLLIDAIVKEPAEDPDQFTKDLSEEEPALRRKLAICRPLRLVSAALNAADALTPFLPRYGYLLVAKRR